MIGQSKNLKLRKTPKRKLLKPVLPVFRASSWRPSARGWTVRGRDASGSRRCWRREAGGSAERRPRWRPERWPTIDIIWPSIVTGLGDFWKLVETNFSAKIAQLFTYCCYNKYWVSTTIGLLWETIQRLSCLVLNADFGCRKKTTFWRENPKISF